jgi:hypothetical protein
MIFTPPTLDVFPFDHEGRHFRRPHRHVLSVKESDRRADDALFKIDASHSALVRDHLMFGLRSSCARAEFMFALVMMLAPMSMLAGTCSPIEAASAVLMPS